MITSAETAHLAPRTPVIHLEGRLPIVEARAVAELGLQDGQVVRPTVEVRDGQMQLLLQGLTLSLAPQLRQAAAERAAWQVRIDPQGRATLVPILEPDASPVDAGGRGPLAPQPAPQTAGRLEQLMLRPAPPNALTALMQPGALAALFQAAPQPEVAGQIAQLIRQWPSTNQLSGELLRRLLRQGGWVQEALLARGEKGVEGGGGPDTKSILRSLLFDWTQAPASTHALLRDAVDDIESRQLQSLADPAAGREFSFSMVLPFADTEPVHVRWSQARDRQAAGQGGDGAPWVVDLHTRSNRLGEVWLRTRISQVNRVELLMWAERPELVEQARAAGPRLAVWLNEAGLRMVHLQVMQGAPPPAADSTQAAGTEAGRLVDVRA